MALSAANLALNCDCRDSSTVVSITGLLGQPPSDAQSDVTLAADDVSIDRALCQV